MNFEELKAELFARGTNYLEEDLAGVARAERWLNQGYRSILNLQTWSFLQTTRTGDPDAGEVVVPDLRKVRFVSDVSSGLDPGTVLDRTTKDDLARDGVTDFELAGSPVLYYVDAGNIVRAYPKGGTIRVRYIRREPPLVGLQEPVFDEEYHNLIVDKAMIRAYIDGDNFEAAAALRQEFNEDVSAMAEDYMLESRQVTYMQVDAYDG